MFSDTIGDLIIGLEMYLERNQLPDLSEKNMKLREMLIDMIYQMKYVYNLDYAQKPDYMLISLKELRKVVKKHTMKIINNTEINKRSSKKEFKRHVEGILDGILVDINKDTSYPGVYSDIEVIDMLVRIKDVIDFFNGILLSYRENVIWAPFFWLTKKK